jgi:hypothetical protein
VRRDRDERPDRPFTGFKLARAVLSADGGSAGFAGLSLGASQVYGAVADAVCVWRARHVPPRRRCGCGFYCLHALADAQAMGCATANRPSLLLEITASGRYIRYERGLRYSRQRVRVIRESRCGCGRPGTALTEAGTGVIGWRHLTPVCDRCALSEPVLLTMTQFAALVDPSVRVAVPSSATTPAVSAPPAMSAPPALSTMPAVPATSVSPSESPIAVLSAEITLLHARLDDLQSRLDR